MNQIEGNLIKLAQQGLFDVIVHGCNCQCTMGAGIAKTIKQLYPAVYEADKATVKGDRSKLGTISFAEVEANGKTFTIVNGYTQFNWRGGGVKANYDAIRSVMQIVKREYAGQKIGYPSIGAGLAKGDWGVISQIIDEELEGEDHTLVVLP